MTPQDDARAKRWISLARQSPPKNVEVKFLSKAGMTTRGIMRGGTGWCDGILNTGPKLYPVDYLIA